MRRTTVVLAVVGLALAAACGGDDADDGDESGGAASTTTATAEVAPTTGATAAPSTAAEPAYPDYVSEQYAGTSNWICHPDLDTDECRDLATTVVAPDGTRTVEDLAPADDPSFDCFYVYPTTSTDPGPTSDLAVDASEIDTVRAQVARYASRCRVFAPAYRQIVLSAIGGGVPVSEADRATAYGDVVDAFRSYMADANDGRGVVLIGHSQGSGHLRRLLEEEIAPSPVLRDRLVSAVLLGSAVPADGFENIPPCTSADDSGCVLSYASYPAAAPPVEGAIFGIERESGDPALCTNPTELLGRADEPVEAVLPTRLSLLGGVQGFEDVTTPFVSLPDAVRLACTETNGFGYLAVEVAGAEGDTRPLGGLVEERLGPTWGLHLMDANLGQDELIELVSRQAAARAGE